MSTPADSICGTCTMCCKHSGFVDTFRGEPFVKPGGQWCPHCAVGRGCKVYAERPKTCVEYQCFYLAAHAIGERLPPDMRPDRCGVIISPTTAANVFAVFVDRHKPHAWRRGRIGELLHRMASDGITLTISSSDTGKKLVVRLMTNGKPAIGEMEFGPPDKRGIQWSIEGSWRYLENFSTGDPK